VYPDITGSPLVGQIANLCITHKFVDSTGFLRDDSWVFPEEFARISIGEGFACVGRKRDVARGDVRCEASGKFEAGIVARVGAGLPAVACRAHGGLPRWSFWKRRSGRE